jgi:kinetochore protein NNF1
MAPEAGINPDSSGIQSSQIQLSQEQRQQGGQRTVEQQQSQGEEEEGPASSPPLPARYTALTPGPRASRFQATLDSALSHTLGKISWDNFAACYPTIAAQAPATLRAVQTQMVDRLKSLCKVRFALL